MRYLALAIVVAAACDNHHEARVGPALLPQANLTAPLPPGTTPVAVMPGATPTVPAGATALAIDVNVPWAQVAAQVRATPAPTLVVGRYRHLRAFTLEDELDAGPAVKITATAHGKFCVGPPDSDLAYCLESGDRRHISAAFVREVIGKAAIEYDIYQGRVDIDDDILWADLVRTLDGARTCCKRPFKVALHR